MAQYWHPRYWHANYWHTNYWGGVPPAVPDGAYWASGYWTTGYWKTGYWAEFTGSGNSLGAISVTLEGVTGSFVGIQSDYFDVSVSVGPTWTAIEYGAFTGTVAATLTDKTSVLLGTFTAEDAILGTIASTLEASTGAFAGTHAAPANRAGTITATLGDDESLFIATISIDIDGSIPAALEDYTAQITGLIFPAGVAVAAWHVTLEDVQGIFGGEVQQPASFFADAGPSNPNAVLVPSHYEICDRTGFKLQRGTLRKEWTGLMVRPESWEPRHPQDFVRARPEHPKGSSRPEQSDRFIADTEQVTAEEL